MRYLYSVQGCEKDTVPGHITTSVSKPGSLEPQLGAGHTGGRGLSRCPTTLMASLYGRVGRQHAAGRTLGPRDVTAELR